MFLRMILFLFSYGNNAFPAGRRAHLQYLNLAARSGLFDTLFVCYTLFFSPMMIVFLFQNHVELKLSSCCTKATWGSRP